MSASLPHCYLLLMQTHIVGTDLANSSRKSESGAARSGKSKNIDLLRPDICMNYLVNTTRLLGNMFLHRRHFGKRGIDAENAEECCDETIHDGDRTSVCESRSDQAIQHRLMVQRKAAEGQTYEVANSHEHKLVTAKPRIFQKPQFLCCPISQERFGERRFYDSQSGGPFFPYSPARLHHLTWGHLSTFFRARYASQKP